VNYPKLETGNGHSILFFRNPSMYPFLREVTPMICGAFRNGLPRVDSWDPYGELVAIESPEGGKECRAWMWANVDAAGPRESLDAPCVLPASIHPGVKSLPYVSGATA